MNGARRYFSDVQQPRVYTSTAPQDAGVYSRTVYQDPGMQAGGVVQQDVMTQGAGPWWARGVVADPAAQVYGQYGQQTVVTQQQLNPADLQLYESYLARPPPDVIVEGDRTRQSNGKPRKPKYSGYWRQVGDPYQYSEQQQQTAYVRQPVQRSYVTENMSYGPYQEVVMPPPGQVIQTVGAPVETHIRNTRVF